MLASLVALLGVVGTVLFAAVRSPLRDDVAWLLYVAGQWLGGQRLYVDLIEVNPPLIVWISALPAAVADWWGLTRRASRCPSSLLSCWVLAGGAPA